MSDVERGVGHFPSQIDALVSRERALGSEVKSVFQDRFVAVQNPTQHNVDFYAVTQEGFARKLHVPGPGELARFGDIYWKLLRDGQANPERTDGPFIAETASSILTVLQTQLPERQMGYYNNPLYQLLKVMLNEGVILQKYHVVDRDPTIVGLIKRVTTGLYLEPNQIEALLAHRDNPNVFAAYLMDAAIHNFAPEEEGAFEETMSHSIESEHSFLFFTTTVVGEKSWEKKKGEIHADTPTMIRVDKRTGRIITSEEMFAEPGMRGIPTTDAREAALQEEFGAVSLTLSERAKMLGVIAQRRLARNKMKTPAPFSHGYDKGGIPDEKRRSGDAEGTRTDAKKLSEKADDSVRISLDPEHYLSLTPNRLSLAQVKNLISFWEQLFYDIHHNANPLERTLAIAEADARREVFASTDDFFGLMLEHMVEDGREGLAGENLMFDTRRIIDMLQENLLEGMVGNRAFAITEAVNAAITADTDGTYAKTSALKRLAYAYMFPDPKAEGGVAADGIAHYNRIRPTQRGETVDDRIFVVPVSDMPQGQVLMTDFAYGLGEGMHVAGLSIRPATYTLGNADVYAREGPLLGEQTIQDAGGDVQTSVTTGKSLAFFQDGSGDVYTLRQELPWGFTQNRSIIRMLFVPSEMVEEGTSSRHSQGRRFINTLFERFQKGGAEKSHTVVATHYGRVDDEVPQQSRWERFRHRRKRGTDDFDDL